MFDIHQIVVIHQNGVVKTLQSLLNSLFIGRIEVAHCKLLIVEHNLLGVVDKGNHRNITFEQQSEYIRKHTAGSAYKSYFFHKNENFIVIRKPPRGLPVIFVYEVITQMMAISFKFCKFAV